MSKSPVKLILGLIVVVLALGFIGKIFLYNRIIFGVKSLDNKSAQLFSRLSGVRILISDFSHFKNLADENEVLKQENNRLINSIAELQSAQIENSTLRKVLNLPERNKYNITLASIFDLNSDLNGYLAFINKGRADNINKDDLIITDDEVVVGLISEVFENYSKVKLINDPSFKITIRVLNSSVEGIAKGDLSQGMTLDFIAQDEDIKEGDVIISSGNDIFPGGLIVGTVNRIDLNKTQIFKKIRVKPEFENKNLGKVLILKRI